MKKIKEIGRGGFGIVDLVQDENGNYFAKKTFSFNQPCFTQELFDNVKKRFIREASVQATFTHNSIMPIYKAELTQDPPSFIMPVAESSLEDDIRLNKSLNGYAISAIMDILAGLEELHLMGITHRDLKPQNVLRLPSSPGGYHYVISDFGLMSIKDTQLSVLTQTGMRMGSDYYTAPEIVADLRMASARSDIYSVGCILHDLFKTVDRIPCNEIYDTGHYADIILCCTRRDQSRRFQSVSDLRDAILSVGQAGLTTSEPQANDIISLLLSTDVIDPPNWERIVDKIERMYPSNDATALLSQISLVRIHEVVTSAPVIASRLGIIYSNWVKNTSFNFDNCDGIANRLEVFLNVGDVNCQAEVLLALLFMGTSHNRWYVERKFAALCGPNMPLGLAKRMAMEVRVLNRRACQAISHLEYTIGVNRATFHPVIFETLNQVC